MTYNLTTSQEVLLIVLIVWELIWKSLALWQAARRKQPYWFAALLIINSAGVLPILYLLSKSLRPEALDDNGYIMTPVLPGR